MCRALAGGIKPQDAILSMNYAVCSKIYNLRTIAENKSLFPPMKIKEDFVFNVALLSFVREFVTLPIFLRLCE